MNKYEEACVSYVRAYEDIRRLSRLIGIQIRNCREVKALEAGEDPEVCGIQNCLVDYYHKVNMGLRVGLYGGRIAPLECKFCIDADRLIQERKTARQVLGAAKRRITSLGKAAMKEHAQ